MNTSFSADDKARAWKPRIKGAKPGKKSASGDVSMRAADLALSNMGAIEERRARGVEIEESYVSSLASRCRSTEAKPPRPPSDRTSTPPHAMRVLVGYLSQVSQWRWADWC
jgi:hypothetical protein